MFHQNELTDTIGYFALESRNFVVALDAGGEPPLIEQVIRCYRHIERDLNWAWQLAEALPYTLDEERSVPNWIAGLLEHLRESDIQMVKYDLNKLIGRWNHESVNPEAQARVVGAEHSNPLETLIIVSATSTVMLITSVMWAVRKWYRAKGEKQLLEAQADVLKSVAEAIAQGEDQHIKLLAPIALGIVKGAQLSAMKEDQIDISVSPGLSFGIGGAQAPRKSRVHKKP